MDISGLLNPTAASTKSGVQTYYGSPRSQSQYQSQSPEPAAVYTPQCSPAQQQVSLPPIGCMFQDHYLSNTSPRSLKAPLTPPTPPISLSTTLYPNIQNQNHPENLSAHTLAQRTAYVENRARLLHHGISPTELDALHVNWVANLSESEIEALQHHQVMRGAVNIRQERAMNLCAPRDEGYFSPGRGSRAGSSSSSSSNSTSIKTMSISSPGPNPIQATSPAAHEHEYQEKNPIILSRTRKPTTRARHHEWINHTGPTNVLYFPTSRRTHPYFDPSHARPSRHELQLQHITIPPSPNTSKSRPPHSNKAYPLEEVDYIRYCKEDLHLGWSETLKLYRQQFSSASGRKSTDLCLPSRQYRDNVVPLLDKDGEPVFDERGKLRVEYAKVRDRSTPEGRRKDVPFTLVEKHPERALEYAWVREDHKARAREIIEEDKLGIKEREGDRKPYWRRKLRETDSHRYAAVLEAEERAKNRKGRGNH